MKRAGWLSLSVFSLLALAACGDETSGEGENKQWKTLIAGDWQLGAGEEITSDVHLVVLDRDIYVGAIRPIAPQGTHHALLAIADGFIGNIVYASGFGTNALEFPPGVGLKLQANKPLVLELHVFNPSSESISGTSGVEIVEIAPEDVEQEADIYLPGPSTLDIPPNQTTTETGVCTIQDQQTVFALFPHMHQLGTHLKTTLKVGGEDNVLYDDAYDFNNQAFLPLDPIVLRPGDAIKTECTWANTTSESKAWGESSNDEMCFSIVYRYPAQDGPSFCDH